MKEGQELTPLDIAIQKIPRAWYESEEVMLYQIPIVELIYCCFFLMVSIRAIQYNSYPMWPHFASTGLYLISAFLDRISTIKSFNTNDIASANGVKHHFEETNPLLSHVNNSKDLIYNPRSYWGPLLGLGLSLLPGLGIPIAGHKTLAAVSNFRGIRRLNLASKIAQEVPS